MRGRALLWDAAVQPELQEVDLLNGVTQGGGKAADVLFVVHSALRGNVRIVRCNFRFQITSALDVVRMLVPVRPIDAAVFVYEGVANLSHRAAFVAEAIAVVVPSLEREAGKFQTTFRERFHFDSPFMSFGCFTGHRSQPPSRWQALASRQSLRSQ